MSPSGSSVWLATSWTTLGTTTSWCCASWREATSSARTWWSSSRCSAATPTSTWRHGWSSSAWRATWLVYWHGATHSEQGFVRGLFFEDFSQRLLQIRYQLLDLQNLFQWQPGVLSVSGTSHDLQLPLFESSQESLLQAILSFFNVISLTKKCKKTTKTKQPQNISLESFLSVRQLCSVETIRQLLINLYLRKMHIFPYFQPLNWIEYLLSVGLLGWHFICKMRKSKSVPSKVWPVSQSGPAVRLYLPVNV